MRVQSVRLRHFKRFEDRTLDFSDPVTGRPRELVVLVGPNGAGKSTILQSIAATLGTATGRIRRPADLEVWPGFDLALAGNNWSVAPVVDVDVVFGDDEIAFLHELHGRLDRERFPTPPSREPLLRVTLADGRVTAGTRAEYYQLRGRRYARRLKKHHPDGYGVFERVGTVFWYTEQRTANSLTPDFELDGDGRPIEFSLSQLRQALANVEGWHYKHRDHALRPEQRDIYGTLSRLYAEVFPGRSLDGSEPRGEPGEVLEAPYFFLREGERRYEIGEMSGAERAVFPLLFDVANWSIHRSVVIIDELELHLHPPLQQALLRALPKLGRDNQFIISTHSEAVADLVPESAIVRL